MNTLINFLSHLLAALALIPAMAAADDSRIQTYAGNPSFWQYHGKPVLLLGGSDDDNLFQWDEEKLTAQLDLHVAAGGNYLRNTMSSRDEGNVFPFAKNTDGKYDLDEWNPEYWNRFERFLRMTAVRNIIVQIELWDPWDTYLQQWKESPWNPDNNLTYSTETSQLATDYPSPQYRDGTSVGKPHDFFMTPPELQDDKVVLVYQQRFVEQVLARTLQHVHVLYCVTNEIHPQYPPEWGWFWSEFIRGKAKTADVTVFTTEMYWTPDFKAEQHRASFDRPDRYDFFEASQNSAIRNPEDHWVNLQFAREHLAANPRPINHTKIYGADTGPVWAGNDRDALERFWRNIIGGGATSRFHRPPAGMGLNEEVQRHLPSARLLAEEFDLFKAVPDAGHELLSDRAKNAAYLSSVAGEQYAVYFPDGGSVGLDLEKVPGNFTLKWLEIGKSQWSEPVTVSGGGALKLAAPGDGHWVAHLQADK